MTAAATAKTCTRCGHEQPIDRYRLLRGRWRSSWCDACHVARTRQWRADNRDAINARRPRRRARVRAGAVRATADPETQPTSPPQTADHRACRRLLERAADAVDLALDAADLAGCVDVLLDLSDELHAALGRLRRETGGAA